MTTDEIIEYTQTLRDLANHLENNADKMPENAYLYGHDITFYLSENDYTYSKDEDGKNVCHAEFNEAKTKENVKNFLAFVGNCEKEYEGSSLKITKKFGKHEIVGDVDRNLTCKKIVTGTEVVPERIVPEHVREITEWDCSDIPSLLSLIKD